MTAPPANGVPPIAQPYAPIVIGVVGHIAIRAEDRPILADKARDIVRKFADAFPSTPIHLLSAMATGADQIVAQAASEFGDRVRVIAPLPMPASVYLQSSSFTKDPAEPAAKDYLRRWLGEPGHESFVLPFDDLPPDENDPRWIAVRDVDASRYRAYATAGSYIVRHCHVLIALWDGSEGDPGKPSGTWEYVRFKRDGVPPDHLSRTSALSMNIERGPVIHVFTPRVPGATSPAAGTTTLLLPAVQGAHAWEELGLRVTQWDRMATRLQSVLRGERHPFRDRAPSEEALVGEDAVEFEEAFRAAQETWRDTDEFNEALRVHFQDCEGAMRKDWGKLEKAAPAAASQLLPRLRPVVHLRAAAGVLAGLNDEKLKSSEAALILWLFVAASCLHLYGHVYDVQQNHPLHHLSLAWGLAFSLVLALLVVLGTWNLRVEERRIDYRGLAEGLRVRIFWGLAGIGHSVADGYLGHLRGDIAWARRVLQQTTPWPEYWHRASEARSAEEQLEALRAVRDLWVLEQAKYYAKSTTESADAARSHRLFGFGAAALGWVIATWPLIEHWFGAEAHPAVPAPPHNLFEIVRPWLTPEHLLNTSAGLLIIIGALSIAATERAAHEELARRYRQMLFVFRQGLRDMDEALARARAALHTSGEREALEQARQVLDAIGREAMSEHAHWQVLKRARPFEMMVH